MNVLPISIQAGALITTIVIIRAIALNKIPKITFLALWGVSLFRLLIPFSVSSRFSIYTLVDVVLNRTVYSSSYVPGAVMINQVISGSHDIAQTSQNQSSPINILMLIWLIGVMVTTTIFVVAYWRNWNRIRFALLVRDNHYIDSWLSGHKLLRPLEVLQSDRLSTPIAIGYFKPRILLPKSMDMNDEQLLSYVLSHEYYHIRRLDAFWKLLVVFALCIHWFNPLVWVMGMLVNRDLEITCDEMVLRHFGMHIKTDYARSLISMAEQRSIFAPLYSGFCKNAAEERITAIMKVKRNTIVGLIGASVLVACTAIIFGTSVAAQTSNVMPQDVITDWAAYDAQDNLLYYRTIDEQGNELILDYIPETPKGDITVKGYEDVFSFRSISVDFVNGTAGEHKMSNGEMAVYTNNGALWPLLQGETINITFDTKRVKGFEDGQGIWFGYVKDGEYIRYEYDPTTETDQRYLLLDQTTISFCAPKDGDYSFFIVNMGSDTIYVNNCTIKA